VNGISAPFRPAAPPRARRKAVEDEPPGARRERHLKARIERLLEGCAQELVLPGTPPLVGTERIDELADRMSMLAEAAISELDGLAPNHPDRAEALKGCALGAIELQEEIRRVDRAHRLERHEEMQHALARLRKLGNSADLVDRVCQELVGWSDFSRAILTRVQDGLWLPWIACFPGDPELEHNFVEWMNQQQFPADQLGRELLSLRPILVSNAMERAGAFTPMIEFSMTPSYIAAPIAPAGRLVGVLYADCYPTQHELDGWDRDVLWAYCEDFARIYERTVLLERMRSQRQEVRDAFEHAERMMGSLSAAEIELVRGAQDPAGNGDAPFETPQPSAGIQELLTTRESEVLQMMVRGASNTLIAERLLIKPGTVKSHVKHILRKLDAVNRAEAIARYMGRGREV
jgi:DNA-binding CsgD family transcriptional regulator